MTSSLNTKKSNKHHGAQNQNKNLQSRKQTKKSESVGIDPTTNYCRNAYVMPTKAKKKIK